MGGPRNVNTINPNLKFHLSARLTAITTVKKEEGSKYVYIHMSELHVPTPPFCFCSDTESFQRVWGGCRKCNLNPLYQFLYFIFSREGPLKKCKGAIEKMKSDTFGLPQLTLKGGPTRPKQCKLPRLRGRMLKCVLKYNIRQKKLILLSES